jgi:hypothetical protein
MKLAIVVAFLPIIYTTFFTIPQAQAVDCPANWNMAVTTPDVIGTAMGVDLSQLPRQTALTINQTAGASSAYSKISAVSSYLPPQFISAKLADVSDRDFSGYVEFQYSIDGTEWKFDSSIAAEFGQIAGYQVRTHLNIGIRSCGQPIDAYSSAIPMRPNIITSSIDQQFSSLNYVDLSALKGHLTGCEESIKTISQNSPGLSSADCNFLRGIKIDNSGTPAAIDFYLRDTFGHLVYGWSSLLPGQNHPAFTVEAYMTNRTSVMGRPPIPALVDSFRISPVNIGLSKETPVIKVKRNAVTWSCLKGKNIKKYSGTFPSCPSGYKLKI